VIRIARRVQFRECTTTALSNAINLCDQLTAPLETDGTLVVECQDAVPNRKKPDAMVCNEVVFVRYEKE
jgi:hypothetical protein